MLFNIIGLFALKLIQPLKFIETAKIVENIPKLKKIPGHTSNSLTALTTLPVTLQWSAQPSFPHKNNRKWLPFPAVCCGCTTKAVFPVYPAIGINIS